ncbi:MAG TPA: respiratory nitrate reductase subunit gamma [Azospirillum sp.]|nr:respiratory nitrate reductase subunit gamma [Azospirillum sp.]
MSALFAVLYYLAAAVFVGGLGVKLVQYARTPAPLRIATMPAPLTRAGVVWRMTREVAVFESLFRGNKPLWLFAAVFHLGLLLVLLRHLRYVTEPVWSWVVLVQPLGIAGAFAMIGGLLALLARRLVLARIRFITGPSDILMLVLLLAIALSGLAMKQVAHTDIMTVKAFALGLMRFTVTPLPADPLLLVHLALVALLMIVFPFSKLLHAPGIFFSPTRNQVDDARDRRHVAGWALPLDLRRNQP